MRVLAKVLLGCSIFLWQHCVLTTFFAARSRAGLVERRPPHEDGRSSPSPEGAELIESPAPSGEGEESEGEDAGGRTEESVGGQGREEDGAVRTIGGWSLPRRGCVGAIAAGLLVVLTVPSVRRKNHGCSFIVGNMG